MAKHFIRINKDFISFLYEGAHEILETDIEISDEDFTTYFELNKEGKSFKLRDNPTTNNGLFGYIEEFIAVPKDPEKGTEDYLLDMEYRISKLELGV